MLFEQTKEAKQEVSVLRKKLSEYQAVAAGADYQVMTKRHVKKSRCTYLLLTTVEAWRFFYTWPINWVKFPIVLLTIAKILS